MWAAALWMPISQEPLSISEKLHRASYIMFCSSISNPLAWHIETRALQGLPDQSFHILAFALSFPLSLLLSSLSPFSISLSVPSLHLAFNKTGLWAQS